MLHQIRRQRKNNFTLKLNFEKAYDRVNWTCLKEIFELRNFGPKWVQWITSLLESGKTFITLEGGRGGRLNVGIFGEGTLYPHSCSLWLKMSALVEKVKEVGLVRGLSAVRNINITNIQYADDTMIFAKTTIEEVVVWKWILHTFEMWFGLKINYNKSQIFFVGEIDMKAIIVEKILGCSRGEFPMKYLEVLIKKTSLKKEDWSNMIEKI